MEHDSLIYSLFPENIFGKIIDFPIQLQGGLMKKSYKVTSEKGTYVFKIINKNTVENGLNNLLLTEKISDICKKNGVKCLPSIMFDNKIIHNKNGYYFLIFNFSNGKMLEEKELTINKVKKIVKELAKIHKINFNEIKSEISIPEFKAQVSYDYLLIE